MATPVGFQDGVGGGEGEESLSPRLLAANIEDKKKRKQKRRKQNHKRAENKEQNRTNKDKQVKTGETVE